MRAVDCTRDMPADMLHMGLSKKERAQKAPSERFMSCGEREVFGTWSYFIILAPEFESHVPLANSPNGITSWHTTTPPT